ncbi:ATP synthase subunit I [Paraferrimonas sedimenticola]|uniref:ATP synthase subunit I n=1 Tax=Paraferrimonas sedimenticola TaxID=375674 RepID=A0AA37W2I2_9GAMM|nr:ATP synthase subunit I [Paraferrimonas sedimenticola]GLP97663.1 ATP synthase subunit I [Paraferrimonas sedimenticola]
MTNKLAAKGRKSAYRMVGVQAIAVALVSLGFFVLLGKHAGVSALWGGIIVVLPNFIFATLAFAYSGARAADKVIKTFYWGEALKLMLTMALFSAAFITMKDIGFMPLFVCYICGLIVQWTAPLYFKQK